MKKQIKKTKLQELEERIEALEASKTQIIYNFPQQPQVQNPNLHYHNVTPCYQNPCIWC